MATNCTDLVDMRDDDVYPPICVQKIFGAPRELGGFTSRYVIHTALGLRAAPVGQVWLAGLRSAPPGLHNSAGQPTPRQSACARLMDPLIRPHLDPAGQLTGSRTLDWPGASITDRSLRARPVPQ
jgi:hypothetical protein